MIVFNKVIIEDKYTNKKIKIDLENDNINTLWDKIKNKDNYLLSINNKCNQYSIIDRDNSICIRACESGLIDISICKKYIYRKVIKRLNNKYTNVYENGRYVIRFKGGKNGRTAIDLVDILKENWYKESLKNESSRKNCIIGTLNFEKRLNEILKIDISDRIISI